jgi:hypothetical protein
VTLVNEGRANWFEPAAAAQTPKARLATNAPDPTGRSRPARWVDGVRRAKSARKMAMKATAVVAPISVIAT